MLAISKDFAPPLKLVSPYFKIGVTFYLIAMISLLTFSATFSYQEMAVAGWIHLFLLGFVMVIIFGAMAQLIPVVLEVGHAVVDLYYVILPLLGIGATIMVIGFWLQPSLLSYGGLLVLSSMIIFAIEAFATLKKAEINTITVKTVAVSNSYLLLGIITGFVIALGLSGAVVVDVENMLKAHLYAVLGGFVLLTIMGLSLTLIPMFSLAHGFDETPIKRGFNLVAIGVGIVFISAVIGVDLIQWLGYITTLIGVGFYIYQIYIIYKLTVRKELDIWAKSMIFGFGSLILSMVLGIIYLLGGDKTLLHTSAWFFMLGFIGFLINGHLYKIVPFLVWFERFAPLVGKEKVPMLHEMYPKAQAEMMFWYSSIGTVFGGIGLLFENDFSFKAGASLMMVGAIFLYLSMSKMLGYGQPSNL
ncbi:hypothetical protein MNB_SV-12-1580 [hydrothermal vent metagenome]|uniref:Uncharacterized protein n=1 Tax=hydrothermal vent metagenome TaxID=652676 RepID=A0A1W1C777_9ZZZZ